MVHRRLLTYISTPFLWAQKLTDSCCLSGFRCLFILHMSPVVCWGSLRSKNLRPVGWNTESTCARRQRLLVGPVRVLVQASRPLFADASTMTQYYRMCRHSGDILPVREFTLDRWDCDKVYNIPPRGPKVWVAQLRAVVSRRSACVLVRQLRTTRSTAVKTGAYQRPRSLTPRALFFFATPRLGAAPFAVQLVVPTEHSCHCLKPDTWLHIDSGPGHDFTCHFSLPACLSLTYAKEREPYPKPCPGRPYHPSFPTCLCVECSSRDFVCDPSQP